jgi:glycogen debranching enzyme
MLRIAYLIDPARPLTDEEAAAWRFISLSRDLHAKRIRFDRLPGVEELKRSYDIVWWHSDQALELPSLALTDRALNVIRSYVERGGSLLLSLLPTSYATHLGFETTPPDCRSAEPWTEESWARGYPDIRGFAPFLHHPLFEGMTGGAYTWMPQKGDPASLSYYQNSLPAKAKVLAVERLYIKVIPARRLIWEHTPGRGRVLSFGAYFQFTEQQSRVRRPLEHLLRNALAYLTATRRRTGRIGIWNFDRRPPIVTERTSRPIGAPRPVAWPTLDTGPLVRREPHQIDSGEAFDLAGERCVALGHERRGLREVWCHPVRILKDLRTSFIVNGRSPVATKDLPVSVVISASGVTRTFHAGEAVIEETTFVDPFMPGGAVRYRIGAASEVRIVLDGEVDLRLMWPLDEHATGTIQAAWDKGLHAAVVATLSGEFSSIVGSNVRPESSLIAACESLEYRDGEWIARGTSTRFVRIGMTLHWAPGGIDPVLAFAGSGTREREAELTYREILKNPAAAMRRQLDRTLALDHRHVEIESPDPRFNECYRWAVHGTDRFFIDTPGLGGSYVAGYGTVDKGWDGGHAVSGRPGYAWYFGRDAVWTAFAALSGGMHDRVKAVLEFLGRHQDLSGKILHELTTSGYAHYDAADSTPLYVILFGRYIRASGHISFARREFARLEKAMAFLFSTDMDGDGFIENTNVGHGWVEGGALFPVHTEHYLACCWAEALREAAFVAEAVGRLPLARSWSTSADSVRTKVEKEFWNADDRSIRFAKMSDGTWRNERTVLPAVGLGFGIGTEEQAEAHLRLLASPEFTSDWGVRIQERSSKTFNPVGYHTGSVWPLFTGWTALAEFRHNRPQQGFQHTLSTMLTSDLFSAGAIEEVFHGEALKPSGVCPRQAWSESMIVQPLLEGMLGIDADGGRHRLSLRPWFPANWSGVTVKNIRVGRSIVLFKMERTTTATSISFALEGRSAVDVRLALRFPLGTKVEDVMVGRKRVAVESVMRTYGDAPTVGFRLTSTMTLTYRHSGGIGIIPDSTPLHAGSTSRRPTIMDEASDGGIYSATLGIPATLLHDEPVIFTLWHAERPHFIEGGDVVESGDFHTRLALRPPPRAVEMHVRVRM